MVTRILPAQRTYAIVLLMMAGAVVSSAQFNQAKTPTPTNDGMAWQPVKTGLFLISGQGGNSLVRLSANGLILVDGKLPGNYDAIRARAKKLSDQPIRALILTGFDQSRAGNDAKFLENGTAIVVQENAKARLPADSAPSDKTTPLIVTYARDYKIHLGGVDVQLMHFGSARTDADTVVYFPSLKVVAVGDLYASTPSPDFAAGGSLVDWGPVLGEVLKLDFDTVIPSSGPPVTRADLQAFQTKIDTLVTRAASLVNKGVSRDQLMGQLKTDDLGWQLSFAPEQVDHFYAELSKTQPTAHEAHLAVKLSGQ